MHSNFSDQTSLASAEVERVRHSGRVVFDFGAPGPAHLALRCATPDRQDPVPTGVSRRPVRAHREESGRGIVAGAPHRALRSRDMKPFLLLASRQDDDAAAQEHAAFARFAGLDLDQVHCVRMEAGPLPPLDLDRYSGILIGGSRSTPATRRTASRPSSAAVESELHVLLDEVVERDFPFLGACYGVGTLGVHQGAVIDSTFAEAVGAWADHAHRPGPDGPRSWPGSGAVRRVRRHKEACRSLPDHVGAARVVPDLPVQMFRVRQKPVWTQFHPELDVTGIVQRIKTYRHAGYFPPGDAGAVIATVRDTRDHRPPGSWPNFRPALRV